MWRQHDLCSVNHLKYIHFPICNIIIDIPTIVLFGRSGLKGRFLDFLLLSVFMISHLNLSLVSFNYKSIRRGYIKVKENSEIQLLLLTLGSIIEWIVRVTLSCDSPIVRESRVPLRNPPGI